jgi:AcrR family transcriptional regulator
MKQGGSRSYDSSFRQQRQAETRQALVEAAMVRLYDAEPADLSYADMAEEVGVSARTVYRHFPERDDLLAAVADRFTDLLGWNNMRPEGMSDLVRSMREVGRYLDANPKAYRLFFLTPTFSRAGGNASMAALFAASLDGLDEDQERAASAVLGLLCSPYAWDILHDWGLTTETGFGALELAIECFIRAARKEPERLFHPGEKT